MSLALAIGVVLAAAALGTLLGARGARRRLRLKPGEPLPRRFWVMLAALTLEGCGVVTLAHSAGLRAAVAFAAAVLVLPSLVILPVHIVRYRRGARAARARRRQM